VGPWRPVRLERRRGVVVERLRLRPGVAGADATLAAEVRLRAIAPAAAPRAVRVVLDGPTGEHLLALAVEAAPGNDGTVVARGTLALPGVARWWPHTHGTPELYDVTLDVDGERRPAGRTGFRALRGGPEGVHHLERDGLALHVNDVPVFARGVVWTPVDPVGMAPGPDALRAALEQVRDAGLNLVRVVGTAAYEEPAFHDLCDELGLLVWQDLMFANLDYPFADEGFAARADAEARDVLEDLAGRPSLAVLCGNSEVEQQVAMLGLDPALGRGTWFGERVPELLRESGADAVHVPSAPCGGTLPMRPDRGVANWFGVGGYRRGLEDARRAEVRFASECLAFANLPDAELTDRVGLDAGVPRDAGAAWDFADVRDTYLELLHGVDARALRRDDAARYADLSRAVTGEVMAAVLGEWRRAASPCAGAIVLWLRDLVPGAGWGLVDAEGAPKLALGHLRRVLAPVAVWMTDEGLGGLRVHVANDRPDALAATLEIALFRDGETCVGRGHAPLDVPAHTTVEADAEEVLGHFADIAYAHRFGPPGHDVVVATLARGEDADASLAQAFAFPLGPPAAVEPAERIGLTAHVAGRDGDDLLVEVGTRRLAYGVRVRAPGHRPDDDGFCVAPGGTRTVRLRPVPGAPPATAATVSAGALNVRGRVAATDAGDPS
jgi:beta-mannosidase